MLSSVGQAFVGRDEKRAPLKTPAWEATGRVAWKPKVHDDVMLNGVFRICLGLVARQLRIPNRYKDL